MGKGDRKTRKGKRFIGTRKKKTKRNCYEINAIIFNKTFDYTQEIEYAVKNSIVSNSDIFDFRDTPQKKHYESIYNFCRENLDIHFNRKNILKSTFLYSNDYNVNAKACKYNNHCVILFNMGLMQECINKYLNNHALNEFVQSKEPDLIAKFDNSMSYLAFQINILFTYYHELAHLFQLSRVETDKELQEQSIDNNFNIINHKLEINADTYASISIATQIHQYINTYLIENINQEVVTTTIAIFGACLFEYILNFTSHLELYFKEYNHPHPLIRVLNIILNITNHFSVNKIYKEQGVNLNNSVLFFKIMDFHNELTNNEVFTTAIPNFRQQYTNNNKSIVSYIKEIKNWEDGITYINAMDIWNKNVDIID